MSKKYTFGVLFADIIIILISIFLAPVIRFQSFSSGYFTPLDYHIYIVGFINLFVLFLFDFYSMHQSEGRFQIVVNFLLAYALIGGIIAAVFFLFPAYTYGRGIWMLQLGISFLGIACVRIVAQGIVNSSSALTRVVILGESERLDSIIEIMEESRLCTVLGFIGKEQPTKAVHLGGIRRFEEIIENTRPDVIVVLDRQAMLREVERKLLSYKMQGMYIYDLPSMFELVNTKIPVNFINDYWLIFSSFRGLNINEYNNRIKRILDVICAVFGIIISAPVMLLTALAIVIESGGPVFYRQVRVGLNEKHFRIIKFRSMVADAEKNGAVWAQENDARVTVVGKFIRKVRIDELPQLFNVLRGEMTLIGPRPERPEFVDELKRKIPYYSLRHMIKPGVSGWAQIKYPYGASVEDAMQKLEYDLYYMRHLTLRLDIIIILRTIRTVLFGHGAR
ncbi:MAG: TIGR03013 family XrtA/PEP-CTERM system glycosyltransferase [Spirochaetota bacterium]